ncbi:hypothetical protein [Pseudomonas sp. RIT-PI-S]|nr:hypothetical protein [Pseudomonas sp. RIT-PI-S]
MNFGRAVAFSVISSGAGLKGVEVVGLLLLPFSLVGSACDGGDGV